MLPCAGWVGHRVQEPPAQGVGFVLPEGTNDDVINIGCDDLTQLLRVSTAPWPLWCVRTADLILLLDVELVIRREVDEVLEVVENLRELFALLHRRLLGLARTRWWT